MRIISNPWRFVCFSTFEFQPRHWAMFLITFWNNALFWLHNSTLKRFVRVSKQNKPNNVRLRQLQIKVRVDVVSVLFWLFWRLFLFFNWLIANCEWFQSNYVENGRFSLKWKLQIFQDCWFSRHSICFFYKHEMFSC